MVIHGKIRRRYLCFTYAPVFAVSLALKLSKKKSLNEVQAEEVTFSHPSYKVPKFRVNYLSIVCRRATKFPNYVLLRWGPGVGMGLTTELPLSRQGIMAEYPAYDPPKNPFLLN